MKIDIQEVINEKIQELDATGAIVTRIKENLEKSILSAVDSVLGGYSLQQNIAKKLSDEINISVRSLDFSSYNSFIAQHIKNLTENLLQEDLCQKLQGYFDNFFLADRSEIKLSKIFKKYRDMICAVEDEPDQHKRQTFHVKFEKDNLYTWYNVELGRENVKKDAYGLRPSSRRNSEISFTLHRKPDRPGYGRISGVCLSGDPIKDKLKLTYLNEVELLVIKASLHEIDIVIDIEDQDDIDNSYDID